MPSKEDLNVWQRRWVNAETAWDQGREHPELTELLHHARLEGGLQPEAHIFSAGCGRAHNEAYMARNGFRVRALDGVPEAIQAAREKYADVPLLDLRVGDVFDVPVEEKEMFHGIFDRAMLCALQPAHRKDYIDVCWQRLRPGGLFMGLLFRSVLRAEGPPFAVDEFTAFGLLQSGFDLCYAVGLGQTLQPAAVS